jgi:hypothetical protein
MSSATSTSGSVDSVPLQPDEKTRPGPNTFRASHFFVLASLVAATGAVIVARQATPEHLILVSLTIASAGLAAAGFYRTLSPLVGASTSTVSEPLTERARGVLEREKMLVLRAIKDLEFDRSMGKLSQDDFEEMAGRLRVRALALMKQLDENGTGYRSVIERELAARLAARGLQAAAVPVVSSDAKSVGACACGTTNDADAVFCKRCGCRIAPAPIVGADQAR